MVHKATRQKNLLEWSNKGSQKSQPTRKNNISQNNVSLLNRNLESYVHDRTLTCNGCACATLFHTNYRMAECMPTQGPLV